jgi:hypothetical protein
LVADASGLKKRKGGIMQDFLQILLLVHSVFQAVHALVRANAPEQEE